MVLNCCHDIKVINNECFQLSYKFFFLFRPQYLIDLENKHAKENNDVGDDDVNLVDDCQVTEEPHEEDIGGYCMLVFIVMPP